MAQKLTYLNLVGTQTGKILYCTQETQEKICIKASLILKTVLKTVLFQQMCTRSGVRVHKTLNHI